MNIITKQAGYFRFAKEFYENLNYAKYFTFEKFREHPILKSKVKIITKSFILLTLFCVQSVQSNNYYFSSRTGDDSYTSRQAQNPATPWKTLSKLSSFMVNLKAGDSILFKKGDVFYGSFIVTKSGTADKPIVFSAYGKGAKPIISGLTQLSNWKLSGTNKWEADCPDCGTSLNMLLINGISQPMGRYPNITEPNKGYLTFESHSPLQIMDNELPASPDWTGGEMVVRSSRWTFDRKTIQSQAGNILNIGSPTTYPLLSNYGYFIQNHPSTLDTFGEWYYNPDTKKVMIYSDSTNPDILFVSATTHNIVTALNNTSYIHFDGIEWVGSNTTTLTCNFSDYISITNCAINFSGTDAMSGKNVSNLTLENNTITNTNNNALLLSPSSNTIIKNNVIKNTGIIPGNGKSGVGNYSGITLIGNINRIEYNTIENTGYIPINFQGDSILIKNNYINKFAFVLDDGGGIYTWNGCPSSPNGIYGINHSDRKITGNIIQNGIGAAEGTNSPNKAASGIYLDDNTMDVKVSNNTISNCTLNGIFLHNSRENLLDHNTMFNNNIQLKFESNGKCTTDPVLSNNVTNNILFSKLASQTVLDLSADALNDINLYSLFDTNYYCRPLDEESIIWSTSSVARNSYNLFQWKKASGKDLNSKITPISLPSYKVNNRSVGNQVQNGTFDHDIKGASCWSPQNNCSITCDDTQALNGGSLKYFFTSISGNTNNSLLLIKIGTVVSGKNYIVKFSLKGTTSNREIGVNLRKLSSPYTNLTAFQNIAITTMAQDHEILFSPQSSEDNSCLQFEIKEGDGPLWFDTVEFYEADVTRTDPDDYIRFEYNATQSNKKIPLTEDYIDVRNNIYSKVVTLASFTSVVLFKKKNITAQKIINSNIIGNPNTIIIYPNPFDTSFIIKSEKTIKQLNMYNSGGKIVITMQPNSTFVEVNTIQIPRGIYFIKSNIEGKWYSNKLIKQ